jgi:hypothetical protein
MMLSELEMRILSELEEAGEESVVTLLNTVTRKRGGMLELTQLQLALKTLVDLDLARISVERDESSRLKELSKDHSQVEIDRIPLNVRFGPLGGYWELLRRPSAKADDDFPYVVDTPEGQNKAFEILEERGYQWWLQKD